MKNTIRFSMALCVISVLTACGGGGKSSNEAADIASPSSPSAPATSAPSTPATSNPSTPNASTDSASSSDLIIDNGRGTSNNQDTESAED